MAGSMPLCARVFAFQQVTVRVSGLSVTRVCVHNETDRHSTQGRSVHTVTVWYRRTRSDRIIARDASGGNPTIMAPRVVQLAAVALLCIAASASASATTLSRATQAAPPADFKFCVTDTQTFKQWITCCRVDPTKESCSFPSPAVNGTYQARVMAGEGRLFVGLTYPSASFWTVSPSNGDLKTAGFIHGGLQSQNGAGMFANFTICPGNTPDGDCID